MPEGGAEREVTFERHHNCRLAQSLVPMTGDEDLDLLIFPVGLDGWEMGLNIPFEVECPFPCDACDKYVKAVFMWTGPRIFLPKLVRA